MDGRTLTLQAATEALKLWSGARRNLVLPIGTSASSIFGVRVNGATHFLRLTSRSFRSLDDATDELSFVHHLYSRGVHVAVPIPSIHGKTVEKIGDHLVTLFRRAPGIRLTPEARQWKKAFFREWDAPSRFSTKRRLPSATLRPAGVAIGGGNRYSLRA
jgi:Ser/Thr protein kinase RdoA (MazF antagonist)